VCPDSGDGNGCGEGDYKYGDGVDDCGDGCDECDDECSVGVLLAYTGLSITTRGTVPCLSIPTYQQKGDILIAANSLSLSLYFG